MSGYMNESPRTAGASGNRGEAVHLGATESEKRAQAEAILVRYPRISASELAWLTNWVDREASAMDMALVASNAEVHDQFRAFRNEHVDSFSWKEKLVGILLATGALGFLGAVALLGYEA